jgi:hypothetical protein
MMMMMINNIHCHAIQSSLFSKEVSTAEITHHTDFAFQIQNVPGGKVNILEDHSIGHSKQNMCLYMWPIPNGFQDRDTSLYSSNIGDKKEILCTVSNTGIYYSTE